MKEPVAQNGRVKWNGFSIGDDTVRHIKKLGYVWDGERYSIDLDKLKELNKYNGSRLEPISFTVDEYRTRSGR